MEGITSTYRNEKWRNLDAKGAKKGFAGKVKKTYKHDRQDWDEYEQKAISADSAYSSSGRCAQRLEKKIALGIRAKLKSIYMSKSLIKKLFLNKQLYSL